MPKDSTRVVYHAVTPERLGQVFDVTYSSSDFWGLATAAVLQLAVISLVVTVINVDIILPHWTEWRERTRLLYTTGTTILATIVTAWTVGSIRKAWFYRKSHTSPTTSSNDKKSPAQMRALTGLADWKEQVVAWPIFVAFLIIGLATTVIVVALTPRETASNDLGSPGNICTSTGAFCTNEFARRSTAGRLFSWTLPDGTLIGLDQNTTNLRSFCSPRPAIDLLTTGIAQILPSDAAYVLEDTLVTQSAIGMPWHSDLVDFVFGAQRTPEFRWASRCLPVLTKNPVSCKQGGTVTASDTNRTLTVNNGDCTVTSNTLRVQPSTNAATVMGACTANHDVGTATILIGAVEEIFGFEGNGLVVKDGSYAQQLKDALDLSGLDGREFSATCTIDVPSAMGFRTLNYSRVDDLRAPVSVNDQDKSLPARRSGYGYQVSATSNDTCKMVDWNSEEDIMIEKFMYPGMLATAAGASWPLLVENSFDDGYFDTLMYLATSSGSLHGGDPFDTRKGVFPDSVNNLEDALGAVTAVTMGTEFLDCSASFTLISPAPMSYSQTRLGPSNPLSYLYLIPSIFNLGIIGWLFWCSVKLRQAR